MEEQKQIVTIPEEKGVQKTESVEQRSKDILEAKTGKTLENQPRNESPLEEVRRLNEETKRMAQDLKDSVHRLETLKAEAALAGKADAGQKIEAEDPKKQAFESGKEFARNFYSGKPLKGIPH